MATTTEHLPHHALLTVWNAQRPFVLELASALHAILPAADGTITIHGRDLRHGDEGVGLQVQYRYADPAGTRDACFVLDIVLDRGRAALSWTINAVAVEATGNDYVILHRQSFALPIARRNELRTLFANELTQLATDFLCDDSNSIARDPAGHASDPVA
jgi:hypothetical protein